MAPAPAWLLSPHLHPPTRSLETLLPLLTCPRAAAGGALIAGLVGVPLIRKQVRWAARLEATVVLKAWRMNCMHWLCTAHCVPGVPGTSALCVQVNPIFHAALCIAGGPRLG